MYSMDEIGKVFLNRRRDWDWDWDWVFAFAEGVGWMGGIHDM